MAKRDKSLKEWQKLAEGELRGKSVESLDWATPEGGGGPNYQDM